MADLRTPGIDVSKWQADVDFFNGEIDILTSMTTPMLSPVAQAV